MKSITVAALALLAATPALAQQGVSATEIVVGTAQDLSGPIVSLSKPAVNGMRMRIDEENAAGGVNGRKLRLVVEDHGYDPKKAVLAAQKMVQQDKIFAAIGSIGTPTAMAAMPIYLDAKVAHLFPLTGARQMFEPLHDLKYSFSAPYYDQIRAAMKRVVKDKGLKKVCTIYQDDDFGVEVMQGGEHALKDLGMTYAEKTSYKRGTTDFSSQVAKMKEAGCDGVVMGTIIRETIGTIATARKLDWNPAFVGTTASYFDIIHKLGGAVVNGFYSACTINYPYEDDKNDKVRAWFASYKDKYKEDPTVLSAYGYQLAALFIDAAKKAGKDLSPETLAKSLASLSVPGDFFGGDEQTFTATKHLGSDRSMLCQIQDGKWRSVSEYLVN
ncbi:MAG: branched-chain amino acid transport system substrate-binding protein [Hyphomicrobiales bacterium]|jgi:branched-chain amino acid transport system substrate-binding protein|nr:branched-chain amino acid transport system substrate-binding protein [Hyphomicrobiales bacterium]